MTARVPVETILTATAWLEEKFRQTADSKIALAIALHYLLLALRQDLDMESPLAQEYCCRAARWQGMACDSAGPAFFSEKGSAPSLRSSSAPSAEHIVG